MELASLLNFHPLILKDAFLALKMVTVPAFGFRGCPTGEDENGRLFYMPSPMYSRQIEVGVASLANQVPGNENLYLLMQDLRVPRNCPRSSVLELTLFRGPPRRDIRTESVFFSSGLVQESTFQIPELGRSISVIAELRSDILESVAVSLELQ
ncbi:MAG: hypothetical protein LBJ92_00035 [Holosporales bacterium]|nr:hypothetical protein [Holosporales bacterium]